METYIQTQIKYMVREDKHEMEKPYFIRYDTNGKLPSTNTQHEPHDVAIHDLHTSRNDQNFEELGFSVEDMGISMTDSVFSSREDVAGKFYPVVEKLLWQKYPGASAVRVLEYTLRQRYQTFPSVSQDVDVEYSQPAPLAHIDYSLDFAIQSACATFSAERDQVRRIVAVNFWKALSSGNDWPLALCDSRTVNRGSDSMKVDVVNYNRFSENEHYFYNPGHRWYYVKDMKENEIIMFTQKDSDQEDGGGVPHASFFNPMADEHAQPRKSIEFRAWVMY